MDEVKLFSPLALRSVELRNRIGVSPMCMYSCEDGFASDWHLVHLGSRAVGGAGLVMMEATAVTADGRISPEDHGIYRDEHVAKLREITTFVRAQGSAVGIQLAHAGRKASTYRPWSGRGKVSDEVGWQVVGPSAVAFSDDYPMPRSLSVVEISAVVEAFAAAARRALEAGFQVLEIHAAHGYLIHEFLSPLSNFRADAYGGSFENRARLALEVVSAVRAVWPLELPLLMRLSCTDWVPGGWDLEQTVRLAREAHALGVDLVDCSSGGNVAAAEIPVGPGYQVPFALAVREAGVASAAVGMITEARQAEEIVSSGKADMVFLARQMLRDPYWPLHAAKELGVDVAWPKQYERAKV